MGNFMLGVLIPLPCDDPLEYVEQVMKVYEGEGNRTDGWEVLELQWSKRVDATPYAYIDPDGSWHERAQNSYPEEKAHFQQVRTITMEHLAQHGYSHVDLLRQRINVVPEVVTNWQRMWQCVTHEHMRIVAFVWCHF